MNLLLDVHAFIWLDGERQKLSPAAAQACSDGANALGANTRNSRFMSVSYRSM